MDARVGANPYPLWSNKPGPTLVEFAVGANGTNGAWIVTFKLH